MAFDELLKRLDRIEIADEAALTYPPNMLLRGLSALPIRFVAR